jgi:hypothetical protein
MDELEMMALQGMMGPEMGGAPPMDPMMDAGMGAQDPMGMTEIPVPNFAVPAVIELISLLEQTLQSEAGGMGMDPGMGMDAGMGGGMDMMDF